MAIPAPKPGTSYLLQISIHVFPIGDLDHVHGQHGVVNCVKNSIAALANSVSFAAGQFQRARRPRIVRKGIDAFDDASAVSLRGD